MPQKIPAQKGEVRSSACSKVDHRESPIDGKGKIRDVHLGKTNIGGIWPLNACNSPLIDHWQLKVSGNVRVNTAIAVPSVHKGG